jgi:hypothetical protein
LLRLLPLAVFASVAALPADATYEETYLSAFDRSDLIPALFKFPGGSRSAFDNAGYDPAPLDADHAPNFRVYIKGAKLARVGPLSVVIYNLDNASVTKLDKDKHTFTILTFAQMKRQIDKGPRCGENCRLLVEDT